MSDKIPPRSECTCECHKLGEIHIQPCCVEEPDQPVYGVKEWPGLVIDNRNRSTWTMRPTDSETG